MKFDVPQLPVVYDDFRREVRTTQQLFRFSCGRLLVRPVAPRFPTFSFFSVAVTEGVQNFATAIQWINAMINFQGLTFFSYFRRRRFFPTRPVARNVLLENVKFLKRFRLNVSILLSFRDTTSS